MALAVVDRLTYSYPDAPPALVDVSLELDEGEVIALLGPSGSGKSTLLRALAGLVPHFHGGRFAGRVEVAGWDTRRTRPAALAGTVASVFQDPEDQVVMARVRNEVAFGLGNVGTPPAEIPGRAEEALALVGASHLAARRTAELSAGELQRVCLASALALRPRLLLLDEPTSQLDSAGADDFLAAVTSLGATVVLSEQRTERALSLAQRVLFVEDGRLLLDAPRAQALAWLRANRPAYADRGVAGGLPSGGGAIVVSVDNVAFAYAGSPPVLEGASLELRRGEIVVLAGPNGSGKTTLAKLAAGLLEPARGSAVRKGRVGYLSQDPGRYVICETALAEVALAVRGDVPRARRALAGVGLRWAEERHPRDLASGERERLALAAVAVAEPDALILDEPTRGMDPGRRAELARWLAEYVRAGRAVLVATHDARFPAHRRVTLGSSEEALVAA